MQEHARIDADIPLVPVRHRNLVRSVALAVLLGLLVTLSVVVGWMPTASLAGAWNQLTHPPFTAAQRQQLSALVAQAASTYTQQTTIAFGSMRSIQVSATLGWTAAIGEADVAKEQARVKELCFQLQKAIWTGRFSPSDVLVIVLGPVRDGYAQTSIDAHGSAELTEQTASGFAWGDLTPDNAWVRYDHTYLRPSYDWHIL